MTERIFLTPDEAAEALAISPRLLAQLTAEGRIPAVDLGPHRLRRYSIAALAAWGRSASYTAGKEETDADEPPEALPAQRRAVVRRRPGRPRKPRASGAPLPLRIVEG